MNSHNFSTKFNNFFSGVFGGGGSVFGGSATGATGGAFSAGTGGVAQQGFGLGQNKRKF